MPPSNGATFGGHASRANKCRGCDSEMVPRHPSCTSRLAMPSLGASNASKSSTGANICRCFCISARNSSIDALARGAIGSLLSLTALSRVRRYGAASAAKWAAFSKHLRTSSCGALALRPVCASDLDLGSEELVQRHVRRTEFTKNLFLLFGRAHAAELRDEIAHGGFLARAPRMSLAKLQIAVDQRAGIALELFERVPMRRGRIAGAVFGPTEIAGVRTKYRLAVDRNLQRQVRIDPDELLEQLGDLVGLDDGLVSARPEHRDARPSREPGSGADVVDDRL